MTLWAPPHQPWHHPEAWACLSPHSMASLTTLDPMLSKAPAASACSSGCHGTSQTTRVYLTGGCPVVTAAFKDTGNILTFSVSVLPSLRPSEKVTLIPEIDSWPAVSQSSPFSLPNSWEQERITEGGLSTSPQGFTGFCLVGQNSCNPQPKQRSSKVS